MFCIIIKGPAGAGKSAVTRVLSDRLSRYIKLGIIHGDYLSHLVNRCTFTPEQLDMKYKNMLSLIDNFLLADYHLIIQNLFRRQQDLDCILERIEQYTSKILIIHLTAPLDILIARKKVADPFDFLPPEGVIQRYEMTETVKTEGEITIDTSELNLNQVIEKIMEVINKFAPGNLNLRPIFEESGNKD